MESSPFPRAEGFRQFVRSLGRRYCNPYPAELDAHEDFEEGWREAARLCGQPQLADLPEAAGELAVVVKRDYGRAAGTSAAA